jgi:taurine transport system ATP-binding protein
MSQETMVAPAAAGATVRIENVTYTYHGRSEPVEALRPIDLVLEPGEFVCVIGPSGCGKTTLLQLIAAFLEPTTGAIYIGDRRVTAPAADRGVVFQRAALYPWLSVADNVTFGPKMRGASRRERAGIAERYLRLVHLDGFGSRPPYELSGGMQQRAAIARVLANDPQIMLMDEPFGALDALTREILQEELLAIWRATRRTIFFITHSAEEAVYLGTRVIVMSPRPGEIIADRRVSFGEEASANPRAVRASQEFIEVREELMQLIYAPQRESAGVAAREG